MEFRSESTDDEAVTTEVETAAVSPVIVTGDAVSFKVEEVWAGDENVLAANHQMTNNTDDYFACF